MGKSKSCCQFCQGTLPLTGKQFQCLFGRRISLKSFLSDRQELPGNHRSKLRKSNRQMAFSAHNTPQNFSPSSRKLKRSLLLATVRQQALLPLFYSGKLMHKIYVFQITFHPPLQLYLTKPSFKLPTWQTQEF